MKLVMYIILAAILVLPASASEPDIISWGNNKTNDANLSLTINISEAVNFNATANQSIDSWNWHQDDVLQGNNYDNFTTSWDTEGTKNLSVNATNANGTSDLLVWNVTVESSAGSAGSPDIIMWGNNKTNDASLSLTVNISEAVKFNATTNQSIDSWNWYRDDELQSNNYDNFTTQWDTSGSKTVSVNATNENGTTELLVWNINVDTDNIPEITSWSNNKTNDNQLSLTVYVNDSIMFNVTANQAISDWNWTLNGVLLGEASDNLTSLFDEEGSYNIGVNGSNINGTTQTIVWHVTVFEKSKKATSLFWSPQVVDYVYVNETINETIEYTITTAEHMTENNWTVDGVPVTGHVLGNTSNYTHTWDNNSIGFHTVIYRGSNEFTQMEFRWYVNVYEIGTYSGGSIFDIIDDALENHVADIKIRMFKQKIAKHEGVEYVTNKVNVLHDEIAKRQMTREALRKEFKAGNISAKDYVSGIKQTQKDAKFNKKLAEMMGQITTENLGNEELGQELIDISGMEDDFSKGKSWNSQNKKEKDSKGNGNVQVKGKKDTPGNGNGKNNKNNSPNIKNNKVKGNKK